MNSEESDKPREDAPTSETGRSPEEVRAAAEGEGTRPVSAADATSTDDSSDSEPDDATPPGEEAQEPEAEDEDEEPDEDEEAEGEAEAPAEAPARRRRRGASEPAAETAAPRRRRSRRDPDLPPPVVRAQAKYVRSSARKARLVCDHIRGKSVEEARAILAMTPRAIARDWSKLLESAVANAEHNHELVGEDLYVKAVHADEGPTIPRYRPRAMGRATRIRKRTSHLTILLTPKD
jgi:ribosomal protein L22